MLTTITKPTIQTYPQIVNPSNLTLLQKLAARIQETQIGEGTYLSYCKTHKQYFIDLKHTNEETRCPTCDKQWLTEHGFNE